MTDISKIKVAVSTALGTGVTLVLLILGAALWANDKHQEIDDRCTDKVEKCESKVEQRLIRIEGKIDSMYKQLLGWASVPKQ